MAGGSGTDGIERCRGGMDLTCGGPRVSGRGEGRWFRRRHNSEKKTYYLEYAKAFGPTGSDKGKGGLWGTSGVTPTFCKKKKLFVQIGAHIKL
jgi:hypothetical protein